MGRQSTESWDRSAKWRRGSFARTQARSPRGGRLFSRSLAGAHQIERLSQRRVELVSSDLGLVDGQAERLALRVPRSAAHNCLLKSTHNSSEIRHVET